MRQGPHQKRGRGRGNRRPNTPNRNQTFDSNGPDVRIRGNASQVYEKYLALGRDASASGDRVLAESYFQHADHYYRIVSAFAENDAERQNRNNGQGQQPSGGPRDWNEDEDEDNRGNDREGNGRETGNRDGGNRDSGNRDSGNRDSGNREERRQERRASDDQSDANAQPTAEEAPAPDGEQGDAPAPRRPRGRPRRQPAEATPAAGEEEGIHRTLRVARENDGETTQSAESAAESTTGAAAEEEQPRPRRRRRAATSEQPANADDDGAAAAS